MKMKKRNLMTALAVTMFLPVMAETVKGSVVADSSRVYDLDEVVVIAQNKEYLRLRQQPVSSTVMTGTELQGLGVRDLREISDYVPSFVMPSYGARFTSSIYVRGIGARINSPSMGIYIDDIPLMNKSAFNSHTYQLDRVDVLRGPQGTLYGVNTEGGLVRQYTKNPMNYQGTDVKLGVGSHFYRNIEVAHYNKVNDQLALSVAAFYNGTNGFWRNQLTGERADNMDEAGGRVRLAYQPTDCLSLDWMADYQYVNMKAYPYGVLDPESGKVISEPDQDHQSNYKRNIFNTGLALKYKGNGFRFHSNTSYQLLRDDLLMDNDYSAVDFIAVNQRQLSNALTQEFSFKSDNQSRWHWTSGVFGSYQWLKTDAPNQFGSAFGDMVGTRVAMMAQQGMQGAMIQSYMGRGMSEEEATQAAAALMQTHGVNHESTNFFVSSLFHTPQLNLAAFHESSIDLTDQLTATLGLRYDFTQAKIDYRVEGDLVVNMNVMGVAVPLNMNSLLDRSEKANFSQLLPKFGLTYKFNNGSNVYATVAKGYRAGGFNVQLFSDFLNSELMGQLQRSAPDIISQMQSMGHGGGSAIELSTNYGEDTYSELYNSIKYKPEESWNYELGAHLNLFDNLIHVDLATYYMKIRNQQLSVFTTDNGFGRKMINANHSYSCGIELALRGSAADNHLTWSANYGYTRAVFKDFAFQKNASSPVVDCNGNKVPFVPTHTLAAVADYRFDVNGSLLKNITFGVNVNAQGDIYWDEINSYKQKFYAVPGAHLCGDFGSCQVNLWGRNLTDTRYNTFAFSSAATGREIFMAQRGNPFQCGLDVSFHF